MNERMEAIKTRLEATSGGPWTTAEPAFRQAFPFPVASPQGEIARCQDELDARFVADSREDVAFLLNRLSLIEEICRLRIEASDELDKAMAVVIRDVINSPTALEAAEL